MSSEKLFSVWLIFVNWVMWAETELTEYIKLACFKKIYIHNNVHYIISYIYGGKYHFIHSCGNGPQRPRDDPPMTLVQVFEWGLNWDFNVI